jgi:DNA-binding GntR family transcriptional regulator
MPASNPLNEREQHFAQIWETIAARIRDEILSGRLLAGERIFETDLAARFGVSRGPVREALRELAREGLIVDISRRGMLVCTMTQADLREVYLVREALESVAAREAVAHATDDELAEVGAARVRSDAAWRDCDADAVPDVWLRAINDDMDFHRSIIRLAKNRRLGEAYELVATQTILLLVQAAELDASLRMRPTRTLHKAIGDAVVSRDAEAARLAISRHYRYTEHRLYQNLAARDLATAAPQAGGRRPQARADDVPA